MFDLRTRGAGRARITTLSAALLCAAQTLFGPAYAAVHMRAGYSNLRPGQSNAGRILVANLGPAGGGSITEYLETDSGNVAPRAVIAGSRTGFGNTRGPVGIALDAAGQIGVTLGNVAGVEVETFANGATGNAPPRSAIDSSPRLATTGAAFDRAGNLYVSHGQASIEVFAPGANGCASPERVITGIGAYGIAVDSDDILYVADERGSVDLFAPGGSRPMARIGGPKTGLVLPVSVALDASLNVYVLDANTNTISEFAAGAIGNVAPLRKISGSKTELSGALGLAVSGRTGNIFLSSPAATAILVFASTASGNVAPSQVIAGAATGLSAPWFIALAE